MIDVLKFIKMYLCNNAKMMYYAAEPEMRFARSMYVFV